MHDFLLAKEIADKILEVAKENKLEKISQVVVNLGTISMAHGEFEEHAEEISVENLRFGLEGILGQSGFNEIEFKISKVEGDNWELVSIN
jgi:Zn finger protein HypA/HybF involved in hydrogenase expression